MYTNIIQPASFLRAKLAEEVLLTDAVKIDIISTLNKGLKSTLLLAPSFSFVLSVSRGVLFYSFPSGSSSSVVSNLHIGDIVDAQFTQQIYDFLNTFIQGELVSKGYIVNKSMVYFSPFINSSLPYVASMFTPVARYVVTL